MGYNTTILILNDHIHDIRNDPKQFVEYLYHTINSSKDVHFNGVQIMKTDHADNFRLYTSQHNGLIELSEWNYDLIKLCKSNPTYKEMVLNRIKMAKRNIRELENAIKNETT